MAKKETTITTTIETTEDSHEAKTTSSLPSVGVLFSKAWDIFKLTWHKQLALNIATSFLIILLTIVAILVFVVLNLPQIPRIADLTHTGLGGLSAIPQSLWLEVYAIVAIWGFVTWLVSTAFAIATLLVVDSAYKSEDLSLKTAFGTGLKKALPLFLMYFVLFFLVFGGYWLLILPGIIMGVYFSYSVYALAVENKGVVASMRESVRIIGAHFWAFLGRVLLLVLAIYGIEIALAIVGNNLKSTGLPEGVFSIVSVVFQTASNFYAVAYIISLYHFMKDASVDAKPGRIRMFVLVSVVGWVFGVLLIGGIVTLVKTQWPAIQDAIKSQQEMYASPNPSILPEFLPKDLVPMYTVPISPEPSPVSGDLPMYTQPYGSTSPAPYVTY